MEEHDYSVEEEILLDEVTEGGLAFYDERDDDGGSEFDDEHDGQPDEYTEWQDFMGGDEYYDHSEAQEF